MLNKNTRNVLGQLSAINPQMIITYPVTTIIMGKNIQAFLDLTQLDEEPFEELGFHNINEFNSVVDVIDEPSIENDNGSLTISNDKQSTVYRSTTIDIIQAVSRGNPELLERISKNEEVATFDLSLKDLDGLKKMKSLLNNLSDLVITSSGTNIELKVTSKEKSSNNYKIDLEGTSTEDINMIIFMDSINKLPASDFKVKIFKSSKGSLIAVFESVNVPGLTIVLSAKAV